MALKNIFIDNSILLNQKKIAYDICFHPMKPKKYKIVTYGCQMNVNDSQKISYMLESMNIQPAETKEEADLIIFNTCCVRENAERKALGNIMWLKQLKKTKPNIIVAVCGCMIQQPEMLQIILKQYKFVDLAFGTHNLHLLPELLLQKLDNKEQIIAINDEHIIAEGLGTKRENPYNAFVSIMFGCNNFCTFCIVPYVRGRERSRKSSDIFRECEDLINNGTQEIMLLGQNVNSYNDGEFKFPQLLDKLAKMGIPRLRFMTSHPKDLSLELIEVMASNKNIANHIHLPVQSGSDSILKSMNRVYNREKYLNTVELLKKACPDIGITTDIIVGFPGETENDFNDTIDIVKQVKYDSAFTFIYSKRKGTVAAKMTNFVDPEVASERLQRLNAVVNEVAYDNLRSQIGIKDKILIDNIHNKLSNNVYGRTSRNLKVIIPGSKELIGKFIDIEIDKFENNMLFGKEIKMV